MKTIVVSAVNLTMGGTLTILRDCLSYLSILAERGDYRIVAIVYKRELVNFPNIEYIETQWPKRRWINRLWFEYVSMKKISKQLDPVYLWLSLHDTSPNVLAQRRAVYCHNSFPFYKWKIRECFFAPKIVLFALFSRFIYQKNIKQNDYIIVQQQWMKKELAGMFGLNKEQFVVALPNLPKGEKTTVTLKNKDVFSFIYAAAPDSHKNFECLCRAAEILEAESGVDFTVRITLSGKENRYAQWIAKRWAGRVKSLKFIGYQNRRSLFQYYEKSDSLVFPSKIETWGLPITEFASFQKPMLLADLPYAHETAAEVEHIAFFNPDNPDELANHMRRLIVGDRSFLQKVKRLHNDGPIVNHWKNLFDVLLDDAERDESNK
jgi:glycosyltransferase involved in cell wall biosynthesis